MKTSHHLRGLRRITLGLLMVSATAGAAWAQSMVSVSGNVLNMRSAPGTQSEVLWELRQGYPLQVVERRKGWLKVKDFENDQGWVASRFTGRTPHHIVKAPVANVRSGPGTQHKLVGKAEHGELLKTLEKRAGWVKVEREQGASGWIAKRLLWGW